MKRKTLTIMKQAYPETLCQDLSDTENQPLLLFGSFVDSLNWLQCEQRFCKEMSKEKYQSAS